MSIDLDDYIKEQYSSPVQGGNNPGSSITIGRVVDVIYDDSHDDYKLRGSSQGINGVYFREIGSAKSESDDKHKLFAYQGNMSVKQVPLKGELVIIQSFPGEDRDEGYNSQKRYWTSIVPVWNHPNHSSSPDSLATDELDLGDNFEERGDVNPSKIFPGDTLIEGRFNQSLRFGGSNFETNDFSDDSNNGKAYTILSNGTKPSDGLELTLEDINEDASSIYLTEDHLIPLDAANKKRKAFTGNVPTEAGEYKGKQVLINSGRLYFNSRDESTFISAAEVIALNAKSVHLDAEDYVAFDGKKIYLGTASTSESEPVLKGTTTLAWLQELTGHLVTLLSVMSTTPAAPPVYCPAVMSAAGGVLTSITTTQAKLNGGTKMSSLASKKSFVE
jgi:hypothetical protein